MSTCVLKALPGKLDMKRHSPSVLYVLIRRLVIAFDFRMKQCQVFSHQGPKKNTKLQILIHAVLPNIPTLIKCTNPFELKGSWAVMYNFIQILKVSSVTKPITAESDQTTHTLVADNHKMEDRLIHVMWVNNYFYIHSVKS